MGPVTGTCFMVIPDYGPCGRNMFYGDTWLWDLWPEHVLWWYLIVDPVFGTCFMVIPNESPCDRNMFLCKYCDIQLNKRVVAEGYTIPSSKYFELQGIKHSWIYCVFNFYVNSGRSLTSESDVDHLMNFNAQSEIWRTKYKLDVFLYWLQQMQSQLQ